MHANHSLGGAEYTDAAAVPFAIAAIYKNQWLVTAQ
jgi:hypothetical protein